MTGDAQIPALYTHSFNIVDTTGGGTVTINALQRVLTTTSLPAADIDRVGKSLVCNLPCL
jgi:sorting nexin-8